MTFTSSTHGKNLPHVTPKLGTSAKLAVELFQRNAKLFVLSIDSVEGPLAWSKDIRAYNGGELTEKVPSPTASPAAPSPRPLCLSSGLPFPLVAILPGNRCLLCWSCWLPSRWLPLEISSSLRPVQGCLGS